MRPHEAAELRRAVALLSERLRELPAAGLRGTELFVLATVEELGGRAYPAAIADRLGMRRSNVSAVVGDLRRRGLIASGPDGAAGPDGATGPDGRRRPVALTERGRTALHAREAAHERWLGAACAQTLSGGEASAIAVAVPLLLRLAAAGEPTITTSATLGSDTAVG